jgi:hypothetical protein
MTPTPSRLSEERLREIEREHYARPVEIAQLARELREARDLLGTWRSWLKAGADEMECRADEDCDHCFALMLVAGTDKLIGGSP